MNQATVKARDIVAGDRVWDGGCARAYKWVEVQHVTVQAYQVLLDVGYINMSKHPEASVAVLRSNTGE